MTQETQCPATVEEKLAWMRANWPQANLEPAELVLRIYRLRDLLFSRSRGLIDAEGLSPAEFNTLAALRRQPPPHELTPSELSTSIAITTGGMTKALHKLEELGYVSRAISASDRRSRLVRLTPAGKARIEQAMASLLAHHKEHLDGVLDAPERASLIALLQKLLDALETDVA